MGPRAASGVSLRFFWNLLDFIVKFSIIHNKLNTKFKRQNTGDFVIYDPFDDAQDMFINYY